MWIHIFLEKIGHSYDINSLTDEIIWIYEEKIKLLLVQRKELNLGFCFSQQPPTSLHEIHKQDKTVNITGSQAIGI